MNVQQLSFKHHGEDADFFRNMSFDLAPGRIHALHGKNGVGKTVLLQLLSGIISSNVFLKGKINATGGVALVNQRFDQMIVEEFSFSENLQLANMPRFPNPFYTLKPPPPVDPHLLERFHIDRNLPVKQLSGGQRQILALMMTLQRKAQFLLLDEPTATLDEQNANMVFEFLRNIPHRTFLVVCHDLELIYRYTNGSHLHLKLDKDGTRDLTISG